MPNLSVVNVPGVQMSIGDLHGLDSSPTQTPAQTRSASPSRGSNMPHTSDEAAEFITKLSGMASFRDVTDATDPDARAEAKTTKAKGIEARTGVIREFEEQMAITEDGPDQSTSKTLSPTPTRAHSQKLVSAIDGSRDIPATSKIQILLIYFMFNLGLTLYNKAAMIMQSKRPLTDLPRAMVTVPFHQTVRALTPVFTVAIYRITFTSVYSMATYLSLIPIIIGVMLASYGDLSATALGFFMTLLGTLLAAVKTVTTNRLQTAGLHFGALELLHRMSPIACLQSLIVAYLTGEFDQFAPQLLGIKGVVILLTNGIIAFCLNVASFEANKRSGALTMTIAANVKQVLTVVLSVMIWQVPIGAMNACGIALTLLGGAWYGRVELMGKTSKTTESSLEEGATTKA
ncbi:MAG: hypothetical protein L6R35_002176 [Caloplaca aegaea]|nr:MAG: hypothetical protein L6R35_002176 [Caloplaca aegaea]